VTAQTVRGPLATALAQLAGRDRDVLLLVAWSGLNHAEVADALAIPIGTVRSRLAGPDARSAAPFPNLLLLHRCLWSHPHEGHGLGDARATRA
jgi:FixJ family two-component response regulator